MQEPPVGARCPVTPVDGIMNGYDYDYDYVCMARQAGRPRRVKWAEREQPPPPPPADKCRPRARIVPARTGGKGNKPGTSS